MAKSVFSFIVMSVGVQLLVGCAPSAKTPLSASISAPVGAGATVSHANGTSDQGGGGIGAIALWKMISLQLVEDIRRLEVSSLPAEQLKIIKEQFPGLAQRAQIEFKDYPLLLGTELAEVDNPSKAKEGDNFGERERDAINFPLAKKIKVNRHHFLSYGDDSTSVRRLVLHEFLGLMNINETLSGKTQYEVSNALLEDFKSIKKIDLTGTQIEWVTTCEDFAGMGVSPEFYEDEIKRNPAPEITYKLAHDIDCAGFDFSRYPYRSLNANLDGNGYAVVSISFADSESKTWFSTGAIIPRFARSAQSRV